MPTGPLYRTANTDLARKLLGYTPAVSLSEGVRRTVDWYFATKDRDDVARTLDKRLFERGESAPVR